jgi:hypothetical protein
MSSARGSNGHYERFDGNRYERLCRAAEVLALDPALADAHHPLDARGLSALVAAITRHGLLDHLADSTANTVTAMLLVDFHRGPLEIASRIRELLAAAGEQPPEYETLAVVSGLAAVLALMVDTPAWIFTTQDADEVHLR